MVFAEAAKKTEKYNIHGSRHLQSWEVTYRQDIKLTIVFTARCYAQRGYEIAFRLSVRLSVRP